MKISVFLMQMAVLCTGVHYAVRAQSRHFDLQALLKENKLQGQNLGDAAWEASPVNDGSKQGISFRGIAWLNDVQFSAGTISIDIRGKDSIQPSFLGVIFHGVDTATYDMIYFRPFNFRSVDPERKIHAVQYVSEPDYSWQRLRKEHNGVYEKAINPAPPETEWFHARIVVKGDEIAVYVNNAATPSLTVKKLNSRRNGKVGLMSQCLPGNQPADFANLEIQQ